ncbi:hypothetical protein DM02DRAFT_372425 [Periconia macrospinosa]|uniref:N-acetyltransferase domain-containing protein n=1 Tax=Periconia macrospinosa TaxID=97972 RepID=A0A2V1DSC5_9PLEO|nr:hypothetical protein DM02DRAFT_372425 [Periconia macrospinosa]
MAAYGKVRGLAKPIGSLPARIYPIQTNASETKAAIITAPIDFAAGDTIDDELAQKLHTDFNEEITAGRTYPQEEQLTRDGYATYFQSYDLIIGFHLTNTQLQTLHPSTSPIPETGLPLPPTKFSSITLATSPPPPQDPQKTNDVVTLPQTYAFAYYIKPNYPGRSSHLCNAGFIVPPSSRGQGLGRIAARSFCYYGPACGYRGSVFNLVYVNNEASVKLWERLGFKNVGRIPEAGRLRKADGEGEEYVDAWVVHGDFRVVGVRD